MNTIITSTEGTEYICITNGTISEVMVRAAYRRVGQPERMDRKVIKCPHCMEPLTSVGRNATVKTYRLPKGKERKPIPGLYVKQCNVCKNKTGVLMV